MLSLDIFHSETSNETVLPFFDDGISCGVPSPVYQSLEQSIDLNQHLIRNKKSTFYAKVSGQSMIDDGISDGDLLVIDRSISPENNKIAVCFLDGEFTCKRIKKEKGKLWLMPANPSFEPVEVLPENHFVIWGIVTYVIKKTD